MTSGTLRSGTRAKTLSPSFFGRPVPPQSVSSQNGSQADLQKFEGNAQGFRLLTRLQLEEDGGLHLTAATLGAFSKYPREAGGDLKSRGDVATKKHGFFQEDRILFEVVATELGLPNAFSANGGQTWARHPLAFLVEAADDICYSILDIEDGVRLELVPVVKAQEMLKPIASQLPTYSEERHARFKEWKSGIGYLRAMAIGQLIGECFDVFLALESEILDGRFPSALGDVIPSKERLQDLKDFARDKCYRAPDVIEIELAGYEALGGLLQHFVPAALPSDDTEAKKLPERERKARDLLIGRDVQMQKPTLAERILRVTDYVSGMTDRHALETYRRVKGITLPGRGR
jgi:dGTPase